MLWLLILTLLSFLFLAAKPAAAICPVCTVAVCASLGLSRWLKVDDTISGLWIGGIILSSSLWLTDWLQKRKISIPFAKIIIPLLTYIMVILPLYFTEIVGHPLNKYCGIDKLLFGIIIGSLVFILGMILDKLLKMQNKGKVLFYYQKVILPVGLLAIASLILYFLTKK